MRMPTANKKPRKTTLASFPVPTAGLISNRNLAIPTGQSVPPGAAMLSNWFPTPSSVILRRGLRRWATLPGNDTVRSLFTYVLGPQQELFAATDDGIWNVTTVPEPYPSILTPDGDDYIGTEDDEAFGWGSVDGMEVLTGTTNGDWVTVQFSTAGGTFVIGVNGVDDGFIYDGTTFWPYVEGGVWEMSITETDAFVPGEVVTGGTSGATATVSSVAADTLFLIGITGTFQVAEAITGGADGVGVVDALPVLAAPGLTGMGSSGFSYVWAYKQRIWFIGAESLSAWYLDVDQVGGDVTELPLGGVFNRGGSLLWGQTWSLDSGGDGGLSEQNVFTTTEGEVAAYQGLSPDDAATWSKVGVYRIGRPMGKKAFIRAGGDLVVATSIGFIPLGKAIQRDYAALGMIAVSQPIADEWRRAVGERGMENWQCELWGEGSMTIISPPTPADQAPVVFVANSDNGAWAQFTGWQPTSMEVFQGRIFFGSIAGKVQEAWVGGSDEAMPYTGVLMPLFNDLGGPGQRKFAAFGRVVKRSANSANESVVARFDWDMSLPAAPDAATISASSVWDAGIWDESIWNAERGTIVTEEWKSVGGSGYSASLVVQITSGSAVPLDVEVVRIDFTYSMGDIIT